MNLRELELVMKGFGSDDELAEFLGNLDHDAQDMLMQMGLASSGQADTAEGFANYYQLIYGNQIPGHLLGFIENIYDSKARDRASLFFAFRGSWKTTTISIAFTTFRVGHNPERANLIVQASDASAKKTAAAVADIIEFSPGFKLTFPDVEPDKDKGWGEKGYEVKRTDISYQQWRSLCATRKDPTLLGIGILSTELIGKHPDGVMMLDDIHDEDNSASDKERAKVIKKLTGTVLPMAVEDITRQVGKRLVTWKIVVGTPWKSDDAYMYLKDTGEFDFAETPVMQKCEFDDPDGVEFNHLDVVGAYTLNWPERFNEDVIISWRNKSGKVEFARMYLLDLEMAKMTGFKYLLYPSEIIDVRWAHDGGVDFASVRDRVAGLKSDRDYFAIAWGAKVPTGGAVISGGDYGHKTQAAGEAIIERVQNTFPHYGTTVVEDDGKGETFVDILLRKPSLRITPLLTRGAGKRNRQEKMAAWFEIGLVRISDADTPFLNALRKAFDDYPDGGLAAEDIRDAVYWYCRAIPDVLQVPDSEYELPNVYPGLEDLVAHPFSGFGRK